MSRTMNDARIVRQYTLLVSLMENRKKLSDTMDFMIILCSLPTLISATLLELERVSNIRAMEAVFAICLIVSSLSVIFTLCKYYLQLRKLDLRIKNTNDYITLINEQTKEMGYDLSPCREPSTRNDGSS